MDEAILEQIKKLLLPFLAAQDVELVELLTSRERGKAVLRFLVDEPGGITLDECTRLNHEIGQLLQRQDLIQESYVLEVSSPGLDRPLKNTRDFQRVQGKPVKIVLHKPLNKQNVWKGYLEDVNDERVTIQTQEHQKLNIARLNIARANLEVNFS